MSKELELNEKGEVVSGGFQTDTSNIKDGSLGEHIAAYNAQSYAGSNVYVFSDSNPNDYCYGLLYGSSRVSEACEDDYYQHDVGVDFTNGNLMTSSGEPARKCYKQTFCSRNVTLYLKKY